MRLLLVIRSGRGWNRCSCINNSLNMAYVSLFPILIIFTLNAISSSADNEIKNVCSTRDCQISSEMLKMSMNSTVDPCHNFYDYACGNFPLYKKDKYETDDPYDWFMELNNNLTERRNEILSSINISTIPELLSSMNTSTNDWRALEKMQLFYKSCMNTTNMDRVAEETIKEIMSQLGLQYVGFRNKLTGYKINWSRGAAKLKRFFGIDFLIMTEFVRDEETNTTRLQISNPDSCTPTFSEHWYSDEKDLDNVFQSKKFSKYAMKISEIFLNMYGDAVPIVRSDLESGEDVIKDMAHFMMSRIDVCKQSSKARNILTVLKSDSITPHHEKISLKSLKEKTEAASYAHLLFDWEVYLSTLFEGIDGVNVDDELELYVEQDTLLRMIELLRGTPTKTLALALWFEAFTFMIPFTTSELRNLDYKMRTGHKNLTVTTWDDDICSTYVQNYFGLVLMYHLSYRIANDPNTINKQKRAERMLNDLKYALHEVIGKSEWIDEKTRVEAEKKIDQMKSVISQPSWLLNRTLLDSYYENYKVHEENFLLTVIGIVRVIVRKDLALLESPINEDELEDESLDPTTVNAFYSPENNKITVPFGIMHRPFFGHPLTAMNYGGVGTIIGHRVTYGFDTTGSQDDEKDQQGDLWTKKTLKKYKERTNCFVNAYNNIPIKLTDENVTITITCDGEKTLDENIADNGAMREALIAYRKWVSSHGDEPFLIGFENFSHEQLLTLAFANIWCSNSPLETLAQQVIEDEQNIKTRSEARVNGVFMNSEEMSRIWNCPKGSPMNPEKKCRIW